MQRLVILSFLRPRTLTGFLLPLIVSEILTMSLPLPIFLASPSATPLHIASNPSNLHPTFLLHAFIVSSSGNALISSSVLFKILSAIQVLTQSPPPLKSIPDQMN